MHRPHFTLQHRLADWPDCKLELNCPGCGRIVGIPVRLLIKRFGNLTFAGLLPRMKCERCRAKPAPVYIVAGHHRTYCYGSLPDWALELAPPPKVAVVKQQDRNS